MENLEIQTTQNVTLEYQPASIGDRILAFLIDYAIIAAWGIGTSLLATNLGLGGDEMIVIYLIIWLPVMFYSLWMEAFFNGQSVGKRVMKIQVLMLDGTPAYLGAYAMRWLLRLVDVWMMTGMPGIISMALKPGQRLGDLAAKTAVIKLGTLVSLHRVIEENKKVQDLPTYDVRFPEVSVLSDQDVNIIREAMQKSYQTQNTELLAQTARQVQQVIGTPATIMDDWAYLDTVLKDHTYLALKERG